MKLQRFIDVGQADDCATFQQRLLGFANDLDFGFVNATVVVDRPGKESIFLSVNNIPSEFAEATDIALSKRDPVLQRLKRQSTPFTYDQSSYVLKDAADLWEIQAAHGYRTGLAVALHLSNHRHFLLGIDRETPLPADDDEVTILLASLQLLAVHCQDAALRLIGGSTDEALAALTKQETECLKWRGEGKSAWVTGQILNLSESRVRKICAAATEKLGCSTTSQAVVRAHRSGILK